MSIEPILSIGASPVSGNRGTGLLQAPVVAPPPPPAKPKGGRTMTVAGRKGPVTVVIADEATGVFSALSEAVGNFETNVDPASGKRIDPATGLPIELADALAAPPVDPALVKARRMALVRKMSPGQRSARIITLKRQMGSLTERKAKIGEQRMKVFRELKGMQMSVATARAALFKAQVGGASGAEIQKLGQRLEGFENSLNRMVQSLSTLDGDLGRVTMALGGMQAEMTMLMTLEGFAF